MVYQQCSVSIILYCEGWSREADLAATVAQLNLLDAIKSGKSIPALDGVPLDFSNLR